MSNFSQFCWPWAGWPPCLITEKVGVIGFQTTGLPMTCDAPCRPFSWDASFSGGTVSTKYIISSLQR